MVTIIMRHPRYWTQNPLLPSVVLHLALIEGIPNFVGTEASSLRSSDADD